MLISSVGEDPEILELLYIPGMQNGTATLENILTVSYEVKHILSYDLKVPLMDIYPRELKTYVHTANVYTTALFKIAEN